MQVSLTDGARWPWLLVPVLVAVSVAMGWEPWQDEAVAPAAPAAAAAPAIAQRAPAPAPVPAPAPAAPPEFKFVGTVIAGAGSFATVRRTSDSQVLQLRVGDRVDGLAVTRIEPERIVLAGPSRPIVIEAARPVAVPEPPAASQADSAPAAPPAFAEGQAPWDLVPPFGH